MKKITRWSPDTCECVIEYEWDDSVPEDQRTHTPKTFVNICDAHKNLAQLASRFDQVTDENQTKNFVLGELIDSVPEIREEVTDNEGKTHYELKRGVKYEWSFDQDRKLEVSLRGVDLSTAKKTAITNLLNQKFPNKAILKEVTL